MKKVICSLCHGRGGDVIITCSNCNGSGYDPQDDNPFAQCHTCYGEGEENADVCPRCGGDGYYYVHNKIGELIANIISRFEIFGQSEGVHNSV
uniref:hypothetical protein n=1 Tax=Klebsiella pneumoniae TaxID=573 RepID=UPI001E2F1947|nr:hypothetical protein [Klebsiella pneumoniae]